MPLTLGQRHEDVEPVRFQRAAVGHGLSCYRSV
jgi:hypothetical protein